MVVSLMSNLKISSIVAWEKKNKSYLTNCMNRIVS